MAYVLVFVVGLAAGTVSGIIWTGATIILVPVIGSRNRAHARTCGLEGSATESPGGPEQCPICDAPIGARKRSACSNRCRAELSRRRQALARPVWLRTWFERACAALRIV